MLARVNRAVSVYQIIALAAIEARSPAVSPWRAVKPSLRAAAHIHSELPQWSGSRETPSVLPDPVMASLAAAIDVPMRRRQCQVLRVPLPLRAWKLGQRRSHAPVFDVFWSIFRVPFEWVLG